MGKINKILTYEQTFPCFWVHNVLFQALSRYTCLYLYAPNLLLDMSLLSVSRGGVCFQRTAVGRSVLSNWITWESVRCKSTGVPPNQMSRTFFIRCFAGFE